MSSVQQTSDEINKKRLSLDKIDTVINQQNQRGSGRISLDSNTYVIINDNLTLVEITEVADKVVNVCLSEFGYKPEYKEPFLLFYLLEKVSSMPLRYIEEDDVRYVDTDWMFKLYRSKFGQDLLYELKKLSCVEHLINAIDEKIKYQKELLRLDVRVIELLNKFGNAVDRIESDFTQMVENFDPEKQGKFMGDFLEMFQSLDPDKLKFIETASQFNTGMKLNDVITEQKNTTKGAVILPFRPKDGE
jgi:hypothetical protein